MTPILRIQLFRGFHLIYDDTPVTKLIAPRQQILLAYLLIHRDKPQARRSIAFQLWPESSEKQALTNLRRELYHLRRSLPEAERFIHIQRQIVSWREEAAFHLDVAEFEALISHAEQSLNAGQLTQAGKDLRNALSIYKGPLMPELYEEWILPHREALQRQFIRVLEWSFEIASEKADYRSAAHYAERLLKHNPLQESWYRKLILLHVNNGNRAEALRVYTLCVETLRHELNVGPSAETRRVYERILNQEQPGVRYHNFPSQTTPFVGRTTEIAEVVKSLQDKTCRLLTLVGVGGIGKTRLAVQVAVKIGTEFTRDFQDGIYFVPLVSISSPDLMILAIAESLGLSFQEGEDLDKQLFDYLAEKSLLLLMDNIEQIHQDREFFVQVSRRAPKVKLLVTSRERLNLKGERVYEVKGMGVSPGSTEEKPGEPDAHQLFFSSASRIHVELAHIEGSYPVVSQICQLLDGNPLAIELAASWTGALTLEEIRAELESGLDLLTSSQIDVPERHRSMRTVFEHSWKLLSNEEQKLLQRLSIFQGRFSRSATQKIAGGTIRTLASLVNKSLLHWRPDGFYEMHQLLWQFAAEKLASQKKESEQTSERFREYYLLYLHAQEAGLRGKELHNALGNIIANFDNIRSAWNLTVNADDFQALQISASALYLFYDQRGWFQEGADRFSAAAESILQYIEKADVGLPNFQRVYWRLRIYQATMYYRLGKYDQAREILKIVNNGLKGTDWAIEEAQVLLRLGQIAFRLGEYESALALIEKSLEVFRTTPDRWETAISLSFLGDLMRSLGEYNQAKSYLYEALAIRREIGNPARVADSLNTLGIVISVLGDYPDALALFEESLEIRKSMDDPWGEAKTLNNLGKLKSWMGDYEQARKYYQKSLMLRREIGNPFGIAIALHNLGDLAYRLEDYLEAEERFHEALLIRKRINARNGIASTLNMLARLALKAQDKRRAGRYFKEALQVAVEIHATPTLLTISEGVAELEILRGNHASAGKVLTFTCNHAGADNDTRERARNRLDNLMQQQPKNVVENLSDDVFKLNLDRLVEYLLTIL